MKVDKNKLVKAQYILHSVDNGKETLVEQTSPDMPLEYIHGMGMMLDAFELKLLGLDEGEKFDFVLSPDEAYGTKEDDYITTLPKNVFLVDGKFDNDVVHVGAMVPMMNADGHPLQGRVLEITDTDVRMDFNHPLAGQSLHFVGHIQAVSEPTPEEVDKFLNPSCGCGGCHGSDCGDCH